MTVAEKMHETERIYSLRYGWRISGRVAASNIYYPDQVAVE